MSLALWFTVVIANISVASFANTVQLCNLMRRSLTINDDVRKRRKDSISTWEQWSEAGVSMLLLIIHTYIPYSNSISILCSTYSWQHPWLWNVTFKLHELQNVLVISCVLGYSQSQDSELLLTFQAIPTFPLCGASWENNIQNQS